MNLNLKGKIAVVAGRNRGLGAASARMLADEVAADGVIVNASNPGPTRTGRWTKSLG